MAIFNGFLYVYQKNDVKFDHQNTLWIPLDPFDIGHYPKPSYVKLPATHTQIMM